MKPDEFQFLHDLLKRQSGFVLAAGKSYLVESRLLPLATENGYENLSELVGALKNSASRELQSKIVEAMTINETFFYRDKTPFVNFRDIMIPELVERRKDSKKLRIWSAAASAGQEPYSIAMEISEMQAKLAGWNIDILASDISNDILAKAVEGIYSQFEVQRGLAVKMLVKYFEQNGDKWQIKPAIKNMVEYRNFNLLDDFATLGKFDIIFCRNVLIYFDRKTKADILDRLARQTNPGGYLVLGGAETVMGLTDAFKPPANSRGFYQLVAEGERERQGGANGVSEHIHPRPWPQPSSPGTGEKTTG
jgi:chemotaxis protein methyltransferase CheR